MTFITRSNDWAIHYLNYLHGGAIDSFGNGNNNVFDTILNQHIRIPIDLVARIPKEKVMSEVVTGKYYVDMKQREQELEKRPTLLSSTPTPHQQQQAQTQQNLQFTRILPHKDNEQVIIPYTQQINTSSDVAQYIKNYLLKQDKDACTTFFGKVVVGDKNKDICFIEKALASLDHPIRLLSSYVRSKIKIDDKEYPSVRHYYLIKQLDDTDKGIFDKNVEILTKDEYIDNNVYYVDATFAINDNIQQNLKSNISEEDLVNIMRKALYAKFTQDLSARNVLKDTGNLNLIEMSEDKLFGVGDNGKGKNMYGKLLMEIRNGLTGGGGSYNYLRTHNYFQKYMKYKAKYINKKEGAINY